MKLLTLITLFVSLSALACDGGMNFNKRKFSIPVGSALANDITEKEFRTLLKDFENFFGPSIDRDLNTELIVIGSWASNTVNAYAEQDTKKFMISIYGGLARHKDVTRDGVTATLCHELGHHLGGYPKKSTNRWSSAEGQADYYATMKCLRRIWEKADNSLALGSQEIPAALKTECAKSYTTLEGKALCHRMGLAGRSVALMIQDLDHDSIVPRFETPEREVVRTINYLHPFSQCRLDTFFQGAICPVSESVEFDNKDETQGACHPKLGDTRGLRPRCWFVSRN
jgi:hypothetical protein